MLPDSAGLLTSTADPAIARALRAGAGVPFPLRRKCDSHYRRRTARDPGFAAGHCLHAGALVLGGGDTSVALAGAVAAVQRSSSANERERRHAEAARRWRNGDTRGAARLYGALLRDYPRDRVALLVTHGLDFRLGRRRMLRDRVATVMRHWSARDREYGYLLGMHAFGLEETGDYERAMAQARKSLELIPDNAAAIHVIAHVLEMKGPPAKGIAWLRSTQPIWSASAGFRIHLAWHLALFQLDADAAGDALSTYDSLIAPRLDGHSSGLVDASALLWRLQLRGTVSQGRWRDVTELWTRRRSNGQPCLRPGACRDRLRGVEAACACPPRGGSPPRRHHAARPQRKRRTGARRTIDRSRAGVLPRRLRRRGGVDFGDPHRGRSLRRQCRAVRPHSSHAAGGGAARAAEPSRANAGGREDGAQARQPSQPLVPGARMDPGAP